MNFFPSLFGQKKNTSLLSIRETLFGDRPLDQWPRNGDTDIGFPWEAFISARQHFQAGRNEEAIARWREILAHPDLEPRHYLQAWHFLNQAGQHPPQETAKQLLGVVIEVALPQGLDLLAAYPDHSARYYNHSGSGVVWEHPDTSLDSVIDRLFEASSQVAAQIGPWDKPRPAPPPRDSVRLSFLTPSGLHLGQGPINAISRDPLGGQVFFVATELMKGLIDKHHQE